MPSFNYTILNEQGKQQKGIIDADSERSARQLLREKNYTVLALSSISEERTSQSKGKGKGKEKNSLSKSKRLKLSITELTLMTRQIATLLQAGMPLEETLQAVAEQTEKPKARSVIAAVRSRIVEGFSFAKSLEEFPRSFSKLFCATIAAGESSGHLDIVLNRLADYTEQQLLMKQKIQQALIYPILMLVVSFAIVIFLLIYVVPKMVAVFSNIGQQLPRMTTILISISDFLGKYGLYIVLVMVVLFVFFKIAVRQKKFRTKYHRVLLRVPVIRSMIKLINTSRFLRTFGILTQAGVPVLEALRISSRLITNIPIQEAVEAAAQKVREGANIHLALRQTKYFQAMSIHLLASGEASGQLEGMLERAANNQDRQVTQFIDTALSLFEPVMILVMGAVVLFIVLAILLPIFSLDQLGGN